MALPQSLLDSTACYTCLGISLGDALTLALWESISQESDDQFSINTELGADILDELGVPLLVE